MRATTSLLLLGAAAPLLVAAPLIAQAPARVSVRAENPLNLDRARRDRGDAVGRGEAASCRPPPRRACACSTRRGAS